MRFSDLGIGNSFTTPDYLQISQNINRALMEDVRQSEYENSAKHVCDVIIREIKKIEDGLDNQHAVALKLASFGESILMNVERIGFKEPHFIYFYGSVNGQPASMIQHMTQLNFLVTTVKTEPLLPARRIGFFYDQSPEE